jgi:hypothetical protein
MGQCGWRRSLEKGRVEGAGHGWTGGPQKWVQREQRWMQAKAVSASSTSEEQSDMARMELF